MNPVLERFLRYVQYDTTSCEESDTHPTTPGQLVFAEVLENELKAMGVSSVRSQNGYVYGEIPASSGCEKEPVIGLIAHLDTAPAACGANIHPRVVLYEGGDIVLNEEKNVVMKAADFPTLEKYQGQELVVTDGTTLLGADDKAGVAEIMTAADRLLREDIPHGKVCIAFTPDEEVGCGADGFDVAGFGADFAYTVDGGEIGDINYESFNAADLKVSIQGRSIHPGSAKGKMINALLVGMEFHRMLPVWENPMYTQDYEGFYHLEGMDGNEETARMHYIIRDHDRVKFEEKKARAEKIARYLNGVYGDNTITLLISDTYYNMREVLEDQMEILHRAQNAFRACGVEPYSTPIRGGTDGSRLSFMGLPCPNLSTGGANCHGRFEFASVPQMETMVDVLVHLVQPAE